MQEKTATITLEYPVQLADEMLTEITMRRPNVGDMLDFPIDPKNIPKAILTESKYIARLCNLNQEDIRLLDAKDYEVLQNQLLKFRGITPPTKGNKEGDKASGDASRESV